MTTARDVDALSILRRSMKTREAQQTTEPILLRQ
jgi:hypothetical protein